MYGTGYDVDRVQCGQWTGVPYDIFGSIVNIYVFLCTGVLQYVIKYRHKSIRSTNTMHSTNDPVNTSTAVSASILN
jgi:hypothetical protein